MAEGSEVAATPGGEARAVEGPPVAQGLPMRRYKLTIAYDGTDFHGWQAQSPRACTEPPVRTVAGVVRAALIERLRQPVTLVGASRTDAGVHADGQVAHFDAATSIPVDRLASAINSRLPQDVEVTVAEVVPAAFDAISGAKSKQYRYRIFNSTHRPLLQRRFVWHCWYRLDLGRMNDAAARLLGTHNFAGFAAAGHNRRSTVRTVLACRVEHDPPQVHVVVEGDGFLYNMVRIIAGTLVEVARGRCDPGAIDRVLSTGDRRLAGPTLPPHGLCLEWIRY
jgi:tRNA pseudouridine38-40 synthase